MPYVRLIGNHMQPPYAHFMAPIIPVVDVILHRTRRGVIAHLGLKPGERVIDAGCGTGSNFPYLVAAVGTSGTVVGLEIAPVLANKARERVQAQGWRNVQVLEGPAQSVRVPGQFDALLLFAVHEILTSAEALGNLCGSLRPGGRVVTWGAKRSTALPGLLLTPFWRLVSRHWLPGLPSIGATPWSLLPDYLTDYTLEEGRFGLTYLVTGVRW